MTTTPITIESGTIPITATITAASLVYADADLTTPVTAWPVAFSTPTTWYLDVDSTASIHVTITAAHGVVLFDEVVYLDARVPYTIDADRYVSPVKLAEILAPPDTWAES